MRALLLAIFTLAACAQPQPPSETTSSQPRSELAQRIRADLARLDQELRAPGIVTARIGETADLGGGLTIRPLELKEDSRCPANVTCVWAGRLVLRASVSGTEREITQGEAVTTPNGAFVLAVVSPGAWHEWPQSEIAKPAYRFGFRKQ